MKTYTTKSAEIERHWKLVDADGATLGRLATRVATLLRGKHKPSFSPHLDTGDPVVVVNAAKVKVTGNKLQAKLYIRHSGYPGGLRKETLERLLSRRPEEVVRRAVRGMLPQNRLGEKMMRKLHVYAGPEHPHAAQKPQQLGGSAPQPPTNTSVPQPPTDADKGSVPQPVAGAEPPRTRKES